MQPYLAGAINDGKVRLELQCEGIDRSGVAAFWHDRHITAFAMPEKHTFEHVWLFQLYLHNDYVVEFSSACTNVGGWREIGSLNLRFVKTSTSASLADFALFPKTAVKEFSVAVVNKLVYREHDIYAECGIILADPSGQEIVIAAGVLPGSVSVRAPFSSGQFNPEFELHEYARLVV